MATAKIKVSLLDTPTFHALVEQHAEVRRRARIHIGVMYRQYLYWSSCAHLERDHRPHLAFEWDLRANAYRARALDAVWIATGKWSDND